MAKSLTDLRRFLDNVKKEFSQSSTKIEIGNEAKDLIYKRVKSGFGVQSDSVNNAKRDRLKPLSPKYIQQRKRKGVRGKFGSPSVSNLTNTGQMLESLQVYATTNGFKLEIPQSRRTDGITNRQVADFVRKARPFFSLTVDELRVLQKSVSDRIRKILNGVL